MSERREKNGWPYSQKRGKRDLHFFSFFSRKVRVKNYSVIQSKSEGGLFSALQRKQSSIHWERGYFGALFHLGISLFNRAVLITVESDPQIKQ